MISLTDYIQLLSRSTLHRIINGRYSCMYCVGYKQN